MSAADDYLAALGVDSSGTTLSASDYSVGGTDPYPIYTTAQASVIGNEALPTAADVTSRGVSGGSSNAWGSFWQSAGLAVGQAAVKQTVAAINGPGAPASSMQAVVAVPKQDNTALLVLGVVAVLMMWGK